MENKNNLLKLSFRLALFSPLFFLAGCVAPGMHMTSSRLSPALNAHNEIVSQKIEVINGALLQAQTQNEQKQKQLALLNYHAPRGFKSDAKNYHYRVQSQDTIQIIIWNQAEGNTGSGVAPTPSKISAASGALSAQNSPNVFIVHSNGAIFYPYLGYIPVSGKTVTDIQKILVKKVSRYLHNPQITVQVMAFNSQRMAVTGSVRSPSNLPITNVPISVLSAVTLAGGPETCGNSSRSGGACADLRNVKVQRGNQSVSVNLNKLTALDGSSNNWILKNGDIVFVPSMDDARIFVLGAVNSPGPYNMIDGKITLRDALGDANGVNGLSNPAYTYVIRNYQHKPKVYLLNLSSPDALNLAGDFTLKSGDVVFVSTSSLQDFSGVINQVTPAVALAAFAKSMSN
ncbi:MAG: polysaccharide biosynthesis/export family protein [Gammaproteobacteria bacterium]|nr:polysaccharide biosynthesis/export family protein [Gammaproteobacteria bacterium]